MKFRQLVALWLLLVPVYTSAGIVLNGTRVIYPADKKEVSVSLKNTGRHAVLVQSWLDTGNPYAAPEKIPVPFVAMPPITRIDGGKGQNLRLRYTGETLPDDRESVFWLNVLAVPPRITDVNSQHLNVAYQTRIKVFYRPENLNVRADTAAQKMQWKRESDALKGVNPTPYYISLLSVDWSYAGKTVSIQGEMVPPYGQVILAKNNTLATTETINYTVIDDLGRAKKYAFTLY